MKVTKSVVGVIGAFCIAGAAYAWFASRGTWNLHEPVVGRPGQRLETSAYPARSADTSAPVASNPRGGPASARASQDVQFAKATNYYKFVQDVLPAARAGDRDAQYYLFRALRVCEEAGRMFFLRRGKARSLDEALQWASTRDGVRMEDVQRAYDRCHELNERNAGEWGRPADWLAKATDAGQPAAEVTSANDLLVRRSLKFGNPDADNASNGIDLPDVHSNEQDPCVLLQSAARTKDPDALFEIGQMQGWFISDRDQPLNGPDTSEWKQKELTWTLLACQNGLDCSGNADWLARLCKLDTKCQPGESGLDYIHREAALLNTYDVDGSARALSEKIDAGRWDDLGFGPSADGKLFVSEQ
jgi:hypothetical protein